MEIRTEKLEYLNILCQSTAFCDVNAPVKIPTVQPELKTIIDCFGTVYMKSKANEDGKVYVRGEIEFQILYVSDANEVYKASARTDFECASPCDETENPYDIEACVKLSSCDCIADSHGEVYCRGKVAAEIICYEHKTSEICKDIEDQHVYVKKSDINISALMCYTEKTFIVSDELNVKGKADEILTCASDLNITGYSFSAGKLVVKGNVVTSILYLAEDEIFPQKKEFTSDFSQIIDIESERPVQAKITPMITGIFTELGADTADGDSTVEYEVRAVLQCAVFEQKEFEIVSDMYSTRGKINYGKEILKLASCDICSTFESECALRADSIKNASKILTYRSGAGNTYKAESGFCTTVNTVVSYADTDGTIHIEKIRSELMWDSKKIGTVSIQSVDLKVENGEILVNARAKMTVSEKVCCELNNFIEISGCESESLNHLPSMVLVRAGSDTDIWDICKKHYSSKELVMRVNKLETEELPEGKFVLVPRV